MVRHVGEFRDVFERQRTLTHGDETNIFHQRSVLVGLTRLDDPDQSARDHAQRRNLGIEKHEDVHRIAVRVQRRWHKSEVEREA